MELPRTDQFFSKNLTITFDVMGTLQEQLRINTLFIL